MSEPENFLGRWSRRKRKAAQEPDASAEASAKAESADARPHDATAQSAAPDSRSRENERAGDVDPTGTAPAPQHEEVAEFDLTELPSLETITAETDIRAFLQKGVPADLTRAALRRAWSADPTIRDFIGIAENQYDFATGSDLPGFGPLRATDDVRKMIAEIFGEGLKADPRAEQKTPDSKPETSANTKPSEPTPEAEAPAAEQVVTTANQDERTVAEPSRQVDDSIVHRDKVDVAMQHSNQDSEYEPSPTRRPHGRALPQ